jgi:hypothetical protein
MKRREFITLLGGAAAGWPVKARAQQAIPVVAVLDAIADAFHFFAFRNGLNDGDYTIGHNVVLDVRSTNQYDQLPTLAADLVSSHPAVLVALGGPATLAIKAASTTIPIVFSIGGDPVELGFVANIGRPGGNITGTTFFTAQRCLGRSRLTLREWRSWLIPREPPMNTSCGTLRLRHHLLESKSSPVLSTTSPTLSDRSARLRDRTTAVCARRSMQCSQCRRTVGHDHVGSHRRGLPDRAEVTLSLCGLERELFRDAP